MKLENWTKIEEIGTFKWRSVDYKILIGNSKTRWGTTLFRKRCMILNRTLIGDGEDNLPLHVVTHEVGHLYYGLQYNSLANNGNYADKGEEFAEFFANTLWILNDLINHIFKIYIDHMKKEENNGK